MILYTCNNNYKNPKIGIKNLINDVFISLTQRAEDELIIKSKMLLCFDTINIYAKLWSCCYVWIQGLQRPFGKNAF